MNIVAWLFGSVTGIIVLIIGCATAVLIVAICHGTAVTHPKLEVTAIGDDLTRHTIKGGQFYVGPAEHKPNGDQMLLGAAQVAEKLSGNDKHRLPRLEDYPELVEGKRH